MGRARGRAGGGRGLERQRRCGETIEGAGAVRGGGTSSEEVAARWRRRSLRARGAGGNEEGGEFGRRAGRRVSGEGRAIGLVMLVAVNCELRGHGRMRGGNAESEREETAQRALKSSSICDLGLDLQDCTDMNRPMRCKRSRASRC
eukprot:1037470-Rhodomonas_salina.1